MYVGESCICGCSCISKKFVNLFKHLRRGRSKMALTLTVSLAVSLGESQNLKRHA